MDSKEAAKEMAKRSHEKQFGRMTNAEKSEYFRQLRLKRRDLQGIIKK